MSCVLRFYNKLLQYRYKKCLILPNKNLEQFEDISSGEVFVPDYIIHPGISVTALICLQFLNHIIIIKTKVLLYHQAWVIIADLDYLV